MAWTTSRRHLALVAVALAVFFALAWPGARERGMFSEEVEPYLERYPIVLEWRGEGSERAIAPMPPYEPDAPAGPRWVATSTWPVVAYDGASRMYPVFIRGHQTALASYVGIILGPLAGGGVAGARRTTVLLGLFVVAFTALLALRTVRRTAPLATALLATSWGMICIARTADAFEVGSRAAMMACLAILATRPVSTRRAALAGVASAVAVLCRATIAIALVPAALALILGAPHADARPEERARPSRAALAVLALSGVALPVALVLGFAALVPFRPGTAAFAGFPFARIFERLVSLPRQVELQLGWLGDATSLWGPLARGELTVGPSLARPALVAAIPIVAAAVRAVRRIATAGERMLLVTFAASVAAASVLYDGPNQFQLALAVEPFFALAVGSQILALVDDVRPWWIGHLIGAAALALRVHGAASGLALDARVGNPMFSGVAQRAAVARLRELGIHGPELLTTVYNQVGVVEAWTRGAIKPRHAWPVLSGSPSPGDCTLQRALRELLGAGDVRYLLLTDGPNLFESGGMDPPAIDRSLRRVAAVANLELGDAGRFATEAGTPGWRLVRVEGVRGAVAIGPECGADARERQAPTNHLASFAGLHPGESFADFVIETIAPGEGEVVVRVSCKHGQDEAAFDLKRDRGSADAPARGAGFAVFYVNPRGPAPTRDELAAGATALATRLAEVRPDP